MAKTPTLAERILLYLSSRADANPGGVKLQDIFTGVHEARAVVNKELYKLEQQGKIEHVSLTPPLWRLLAPCSASAATATQQALLPPKLVATCQSESTASPECALSQSVVTSETSAAVAAAEGLGSELLSAACSVSYQLSDSSGTSHRNDNAEVQVSVDSLCLSTAELSLMPAQAASSKTVTTTVGDDDKVIETKIIGLLTNGRSPVKKTHIMQDLGIASKDANRVLHKLLKEGMVSKSEETPPVWQLVKDPSSIKADSGDNLKKSTNNTLSVPALNKLTESHGKVGMICSPTTQGTGFRVGACYLMTAAHVLLDIAGDNNPTSPLPTSTPAAWTKNGAAISATAAATSDHESGANGDGVTASIKINTKYLCQDSVYVTFDYEKASVDSPRYHFDNWFWLNEELDVALLRLKEFSKDETKSLPGNLNALLDWKKTPVRKGAVIIMGHQDNKAKEIDMNGKLFNPDFSELDDQLYQEAKKQQGNFIFYRTHLMHGSSGAPIFVIAGDSIKLIGIHLKSFPSADAIDTEQKRGKRVRQFQGGVRLDAVHKAFIAMYDKEFVNEVFG